MEATGKYIRSVAEKKQAGWASYTSFALSGSVKIKDDVQGLSQLPRGGCALCVLTHGSNVHCLGMKTAVEEFLGLE